MTVLEYLKSIGVGVKPMGIKVDRLKDHIGRPVWSSRGKQWKIIRSVEYLPMLAEVVFTDGTIQRFSRGLQETWLQVTEGGDTDGQEDPETVQGAAERTGTE